MFFVRWRFRRLERRLRENSRRFGDGILDHKDIKVLERFGADATKLFIKALNDDDGTVRRAAVLVLKRIKDRRAVDPLIALVGSKISDDVVEALGEIGDARAVDALISAFKINWGWLRTPNLRESTSEALRKIGAPAVEPLIQALTHLRQSMMPSARN